jgi:phosphate transport system substrate-binding protein
MGVGLMAAACGGDDDDATGDVGLQPPDLIVGAGGSFAHPLYSKWGEEYQGEVAVKVDYRSMGSGGVAAVQDHTADFGVSDAPLRQSALVAAGIVQFPVAARGVVPVANVQGVGDGGLRLTAEVLARIFAGEITSWDDAAIAEFNPDLSLPAETITVVHRSDASGTTGIFTRYLAAAAGGAWTAAGEEITWPVGVTGEGNEGMVAEVQRLDGSIGYVDYAAAPQNGLATITLRNKAGRWVKPSPGSLASAVKKADWKGALPSMYLELVDQAGEGTWPIVGATYVSVQRDQQDAGRGQTLFEFLAWCYEYGSASAESLDCSPIPASVSGLVQKKVWPMVTVSGTPIW